VGFTPSGCGFHAKVDEGFSLRTLRAKGAKGGCFFWIGGCGFHTIWMWVSREDGCGFRAKDAKGKGREGVMWW